MPIARHLQQLTRRNYNPDRIACVRRRTSFCLALLPMGFTQPTQSPESLVRSYRTVSPLPGKPRTALPRSELLRRSAFCCTCPVLADGGRYPPSCSVEPGLSSPPNFDAANTRPPAGPSLVFRIQFYCIAHVVFREIFLKFWPFRHRASVRQHRRLYLALSDS
jgi:hypothetical protein